MSDSISIDTTAVPHPSAARIVAIARRHIESRTESKVFSSGNTTRRIRLEIEAGIGTDGFRIEDAPDGTLRIVGNDPRGLLYGVGRLLHGSTFASAVFTPSRWRGTSVPDKPIRGAYFATHFHNFYHDAPLAEVECYLEDIALWGLNTLNVWFDMHHYQGIDDSEAQRMVGRLKSLLNTAKNLGLATSLVFLGNEAYANSPANLRADTSAGHDGYFRAPGGFGVELCPNKPGARELMLKWVEERLQAFADLAPDYLWIWPYDTGGCSCSKCAPWGCNGFLAIAEPTAQLYRRYVPHGKVILSTWFFGRFTQGEWEGLARAFEKKPAWVDYIMADGIEDTFPAYPLRHGVPGGLPLLSFPEISMHNSFWGGLGANPLPHRFQALWDESGPHLAGGFPYSEGIYEDINKVVISQFQWDQERKAMDTVREYIAFEYSPDVVDGVATAIEILEKNNQHSLKEVNGVDYVPMNRATHADKAFALLQDADRRLPARAQTSWRWRILYLRAQIDAELAANQFRLTDRCEEACQELVRIFHAQHAAFAVSPPTREALRLRRPY